MRLIISAILIMSLSACGRERTDDMEVAGPRAKTGPSSTPPNSAGAAETNKTNRVYDTGLANANPILQWELALCKDFAQSSLVEAFHAKVFADTALTDSERKTLNACKTGGAENLDDSAGIGGKRFVRSLRLFPELIRKPAVDGKTLAHELTIANDLRLLKLLIAEDPESVRGTKDQWHRSPLFYATSAEAAELLWNLNSPNDVDNNGMSVVNFMARQGHGWALRYLITDSPNLCRQNGNSWTYWTAGWWRSFENKVYGNIINLPDLKGQTALHSAVISGDSLATETLASCPATDLGFTDFNRRTALHYAAVQKNFSLGLVILNRGTQGLDEAFLAAKSKFIEVNAQDSQNNTALHFAYRCGNTEAQAMLRRFGADPAIKNSDLLTADDPRSIALGCPVFK